MGQATFVLIFNEAIRTVRHDPMFGGTLAEAIHRLPSCINHAFIMDSSKEPGLTAVARVGPSFDTNDAMLLEYDHGRLSRLPLDESEVVESALRRYRKRKTRTEKQAQKT